MTCYEILTGKSPLDNLRASEYEPVLSGRRPELPGDLNPKLCDLICKCWHGTPEERPTACKIILELRQMVEEMRLPPIQELVPCFPDYEGLASHNPTSIQQVKEEMSDLTSFSCSRIITFHFTTTLVCHSKLASCCRGVLCNDN